MKKENDEMDLKEEARKEINKLLREEGIPVDDDSGLEKPNAEHKRTVEANARDWISKIPVKSYRNVSFNWDGPEVTMRADVKPLDGIFYIPIKFKIEKGG